MEGGVAGVRLRRHGEVGLLRLLASQFASIACHITAPDSNTIEHYPHV
jgi:hypothetical protein